MRELESLAHQAAGGPFSLESPKQLQDVLFGKLGLPVLRKTPTGQPSTAEDVLEELAGQYELPRTIMDYRAHAKLKSTYTDKLPGGRRSQPPDACRRTSRTCRTFPSARPKAAASAAHSSRARAGASSPPIIRRSSCASWRTCPAMRAS
jgi:DNA polymerase-1